MKKIFAFLILLITFVFASFAQTDEFDVIIKNGTIYDGSGGKPFKTDVAIGNLSKVKAKQTVDAKGLAIGSFSGRALWGLSKVK